MTTEDTIYVNVVDKRHEAGWRIIGDCPESVCTSGGLHVYIGRPCLMRDAATDRILVQARSLRILLQRAADTFGMPLVLTDEDTWQVTQFEPSRTKVGGVP